jgi:hypothetical protein
MKVLTICGRAAKNAEFENGLNSFLFPPFKIATIIPLAAQDDTKKFLAYVDYDTTEGITEEAPDALAEFLQEQGYEVVVHDNVQDAIEYANEEYGAEAFEPFSAPIKSTEIWMRDILVALISAGETVMMRGLFDKKPVAIICHNAHGHGDNDVVFTPLAIVMDEELAERLELPFKSSYDK